MPRTLAAAMYSEVSQDCVVGASVTMYSSSVARETSAAIRYGGRSGAAATSTGATGLMGERFGVATERSVMVSQLVSELPHARQYHRQPALVRRGDHLGVADRAPRLNDRRDTRLRRLVHAVAEWKERVARQHGAGGVEPLLARLVRAQD